MSSHLEAKRQQPATMYPFAHTKKGEKGYQPCHYDALFTTALKISAFPHPLYIDQIHRVAGKSRYILLCEMQQLIVE